MSKRSEKALDKSIEHWFRIRDENEKVGPGNCALCNLYQTTKPRMWTVCFSCPVYKKTENHACHNTPYAVYACFPDNDEPKRKRLAQGEIDFLQSCYY